MIDFKSIHLTLLTNLAYSILVIIIAFFSIKSISLIRKRIEKRLMTGTHNKEQLVQIETFLAVSEYIARVSIIFIALIWILAIFGVDIRPIITTVGVAGLAVSLSAQTIIKDYIGGMVILVENLFFIGDIVTIGVHTGRVIKITLRSTYLVDDHENTIIIPNGDIRTLVRDSSRVNEKNKAESNQ